MGKRPKKPARRAPSHKAENARLRKQLEKAKAQLAALKHSGGSEILEALRESEARYRSVVAAMAEGIVVQSADGVIRACNQSAERILGLTADQMMGRTSMDPRWGAVHEDGSPFPGEEHPTMITLRTGRPCHDVIMGVNRPDGALTWISINSQPLFIDGEQHLHAVVASFADITARKRVEEALRHGEQRLKRITDAVPGAVYQYRLTADGDQRFDFVSRGAVEVLGIPADEIERDFRLAWGKVLPEDVDELRRSIRASAEAFQGWDHEFRLRDAGGRTRWVRGKSVPERVGDDIVWTGIIVDISERRQAETDLRSRTALLDELFEGAPEAIVMLDTHDRVIRVNHEFTATFGHTQDEAIGRQINDLVVPEDRREEASGYTRQLARGSRLNVVETVRRRKDGTPVHVSILGMPVRVAGGQVAMYAIYRDITEQKGLEAQLLQALKMESIGRLAGGVAHDFNNLLTAILGYATIGEETLVPGDPQRANIEEIKHAANRAADLTRQLLAFARRQIIEPRTTDLGGLVANMEKMLRRLISEHVDLVTAPSPGLWLVKVDPGQFEQVIVNLVVNARDAMPDGGRLTIGTSNVVIDNATASRHPEMPTGDWVLLVVSDTGNGMSEDTIIHIFEPFYTTKEVGKGTGLGLATCYGIVKQNHGYIFATSEVGEGSTFRIYLPRVESGILAATPADARQQMPHGSETLLIVEDEPAVRSVSVKSLRRLGYSVLEAASGDDAMRVAGGHGGPIDLLITDMVMPRIGGDQVAALMREARPGIKVLYVSGYASEAILNRAMPDERVNFLQKPFTPVELAQRVREALDTGER